MGKFRVRAWVKLRLSLVGDTKLHFNHSGNFWLAF
jgi:hypothetical protein